MSLREEFERSGNWLFRWRSYLPLLLIFPVAVAAQQYHWPLHSHALQERWEIVCLVVSFGGFLVRILTVGFVPKGTSGRNAKKGQIAERLNTTGMYSVVRHPLYFGNFLIGLGMFMFYLFWWLVAIYVLAFWLFYERICFVEEDYLRRKFGDAFEEWSRNTPAFIPHPWKWRRPHLEFSLRSVLRREYGGMLAIATPFLALEASEHYVVEGHIPFEPFWVAFIIVSLAIYLTLRLLKKCTRLLYVEGR